MFATDTGIKEFNNQAISRFKAKALNQAQTQLLPDQVIAIYWSPGRTSMLAQLFQVATRVITDIKNKRGEYAPTIQAMLLKRQRAFLKGGYCEKVVQY